MNKITLKNGTIIAYEEAGEGQPIVLLHGYCGSHQYWDEIMPSLSKKNRVIALDLPGHGASSAIEGEYSMEQLAAGVAELLDELKLSQVHLFGHSLGGYVSLAFAERYSERLYTLGLLHSTSFPDGEAAQANRTKAAEAVAADGINPFVDGLIPKLFTESHRLSMSEQLTKAIKIGYGTSPEGAIGCAFGMKIRPDRTTVLEQLDKPILLLAGERDEVIPAERRFPVSKKNVAAHTLGNVAHMGMIEAPNAFAAALVQFLQENRGFEGV